MTTYTISGGETLRGMTAAEVADYILSADGYRWELRDEPSRVEGQRLWTIYRSTASANSTIGARNLTAHGKPVVAATEAEAMALIAARMLTDFTGWRGFNGEVMTDAEYDRLAATAE